MLALVQLTSSCALDDSTSRTEYVLFFVTNAASSVLEPRNSTLRNRAKEREPSKSVSQPGKLAVRDHMLNVRAYMLTAVRASGSNIDA